MKLRASYGTWQSTVTTALVANAARLNDVMWAGDALVWHIQNGTQHSLYAQRGGDAPLEISGGKMASGKIAYGGGALATHPDGTVVFVGAGGRLYRTTIDGGAVRTITPGFGGPGGLAISPDGETVVYGFTYENRDALVLADLAAQQFPRKLYAPGDFVMNPVWHPDGRRIALMTWDHPNMPWDGCEIHLLTLDDRLELADVRTVAGGPETSTLQPTFSPDGRLLAYISDETGWWHIYVHNLETGATRRITGGEAEYGGPALVSGLRYFAFTPDSQAIIARRSVDVTHSLWRIDLAGGGETRLLENSPYVYFEQIGVSAGGRVAAVASGPEQPNVVITCDLDGGDLRIHERTVQTVFAPGTLSVPEHLTFPTRDGKESHALFYPPTNPRYESPGLPPVIVLMHGGPTSAVYPRFEAQTQFYATRGFAVLALNFRGSTGYGREYMNMLRHRWGDIDLTDALDGLAHMVQQGRADPAKAIILGGSAGGYAVLQALVDYPGTFKAGVNLYGVSDQFALVKDTHKFEARYSDFLLGPLPESAARYRDRSPLFHADKIRDALIVFQGAEDNVVPQNQSDKMIDLLRARGVPVEYHIYTGEGHGFRKPETIDHYLKSVLAFLERTVIYA